MAGKSLKLIAAAAALTAAGCFSRAVVRGPGDPGRGVDIQWWGHSSFSFQDSTGRILLIDPFDETVGYRQPGARASVVLITHNHFDHNFIPRINKYDLVSTSGTHTADGVEITGILGWHDDAQGKRNGRTLFFIWSMAGIKFAHLGDLGQSELTSEQKDALKGVDVLFVPVGGKTTVDARGAAAIASALNPRIIVPMHYGNERVRFFEFDGVGPFLKLFDNVRTLPDSQFRAQAASLPEKTTVYVPSLPE